MKKATIKATNPGKLGIRPLRAQDESTVTTKHEEWNSPFMKNSIEWNIELFEKIQVKKAQ